MALLVGGLFLWSTSAQAFFCFSFGSKSRGSAYAQSRYYPPPGAWVPPPVISPYPALPYHEPVSNSEQVLPSGSVYNPWELDASPNRPETLY